MRDKEVIIKDIIKNLNHIRPYINSEGGDIEFISYDDGVVRIKMHGACVDCVGLDSTVKDGIESLLVYNVAEVIEVINVSDEDLDVING